MLKKLQKRLWKNKKGFTLVELIVVIVIIAILAAALVVSLVGYIDKAHTSAAQQEASDVYTAAQAVMSQDSATYTSIAAETEASDALIAEINKLLGKDMGEDTSIKYGTNDKATITSFVYVASNGKTCTYNGTTWEVA